MPIVDPSEKRKAELLIHCATELHVIKGKAERLHTEEERVEAEVQIADIEKQITDLATNMRQLSSALSVAMHRDHE